MSGDEQRVKATVLKAEKLNFTQESRYLLSLLNNPAIDDPNASRGSATSVANNQYMGVSKLLNFLEMGMAGVSFLIDTELHNSVILLVSAGLLWGLMELTLSAATVVLWGITRTIARCF